MGRYMHILPSTENPEVYWLACPPIAEPIFYLSRYIQALWFVKVSGEMPCSFCDLNFEDDDTIG